MKMRGRFAPSPTGRLHLGNARSALLGWLWARSTGGQFLLRIEDLDPARSRAELTSALLEDLAYLGLDWDEAPLFQSQRQAVYDDAIQTLERRGLVYPCFCSRAEIARAASAPHGPSDEGPRYPGTCASGIPKSPSGSTPGATRLASLRFRVPPGVVHFADGLAGDVSQDVFAAVGDFVVRRADGVASYQLAVVVDDAASGITHVLRGDDLLWSTPRQLALYRALELPPPAYAHVPLLVGVDGKRLAKREGAFAVSELRQAGVPAERVLGLLAGWSGLGAGTPTTAKALVPGFELGKLTRTPTVVSESDVRAQLGI